MNFDVRLLVYLLLELCYCHLQMVGYNLLHYKYEIFYAILVTLSYMLDGIFIVLRLITACKSLLNILGLFLS